MSRNNIKEALANNEITVDSAFNNLLLIANVINNKELLKWVEHEKIGYTETDVLPVYRRSEKSMHFLYSGLNGTYPINDAPMPVSYFPESIRNEIVNIKVLEGIKAVERQLTVKDAEWSLKRDCTEYCNDVYMNTGIQCFSINQVLQKSHYEKVYDTVKFHLMKVLMMIEKWFGTLDTAELSTKKFEKQKILDAAKEISAYVANLHKSIIPTPRISMPANAPQSQPLQDTYQQPPVYQPQQPPVYQPQQPPVYQPQQPPVYQPQQPPVYQPQQPPVYQPQQPPVQQQQPPPIRISPQQVELPQQIEPPKEVLAESQQAVVNENRSGETGGQEEKEQLNIDEAEAKIKAAEIRKDRVPKSLLDYLEEKKSELNKKPE